MTTNTNHALTLFQLPQMRDHITVNKHSLRSDLIANIHQQNTHNYKMDTIHRIKCKNKQM